MKTLKKKFKKKRWSIKQYEKVPIQFNPIKDVLLRNRRLSWLFIMLRMHWPQNYYFNRSQSGVKRSERQKSDCELLYWGCRLERLTIEVTFEWVFEWIFPSVEFAELLIVETEKKSSGHKRKGNEVFRNENAKQMHEKKDWWWVFASRWRVLWRGKKTIENLKGILKLKFLKKLSFKILLTEVWFFFNF